jgi:hypothetical protein
MSERTVGALLDTFGVTLDLDDGQQVTEVVVLGKVADFEHSETALVMGASEGLDWIAQRGLISAAQHILDNDS